MYISPSVPVTLFSLLAAVIYDINFYSGECLVFEVDWLRFVSCFQFFFPQTVYDGWTKHAHSPMTMFPPLISDFLLLFSGSVVSQVLLALVCLGIRAFWAQKEGTTWQDSLRSRTCVRRRWIIQRPFRLARRGEEKRRRDGHPVPPCQVCSVKVHDRAWTALSYCSPLQSSSALHNLLGSVGTRREDTQRAFTLVHCCNLFFSCILDDKTSPHSYFMFCFFSSRDRHVSFDVSVILCFISLQQQEQR